MQLYATFGTEVAKLRASPPQALALPDGVVYYEAEKLELPALPAAVKVEVETEKAGVAGEDNEAKGEMVLVETLTVEQEEIELGSGVVQIEESLLVKLEVSG